MLNRGARGALALVGIAMALVRCAADEPASNGATDAAPEAGPAPLSAECAACVEQECELPWRACEADPACKAVEGCWTAATSAIGAEACLSDLAGDAGNAVLTTLARCAATECGTICPAAPISPESVSSCEATIGDPFVDLADRSGAYQTCACERCSAGLLACAPDAKCTEVVGCFIRSRCVGQACLSACESVAGTGWGNLSIVVLTCLDRCADPIGPDAGTP